MRLVFDMETRDPDDILTLCLLCDHPAVWLSAVTLNPGTMAQVGIVREVLRRAGQRAIPIGVRTPDADRDVVSPFHYAWLGKVSVSQADAVAHEILADVFTRYPETVLLTGAPLHNLRLLLRQHSGITISRWVAQGGFAGDNVVPVQYRLTKFTGMDTCVTYNFNGDKKATLLALETPQIKRRELVSKNVTHGVAWDRQLHTQVGERLAQARVGLSLGHQAMEVYLRTHPRASGCTIRSRPAWLLIRR